MEEGKGPAGETKSSGYEPAGARSSKAEVGAFETETMSVDCSFFWGRLLLVSSVCFGIVTPEKPRSSTCN